MKAIAKSLVVTMRYVVPVEHADVEAAVKRLAGTSGAHAEYVRSDLYRGDVERYRAEAATPTAAAAPKEAGERRPRRAKKAAPAKGPAKARPRREAESRATG